MAENIENNGCSQRDNAEHEGYVKASRSFNRIWKERDSAQPRLLETILYKDNFNRAYKRVKANKGAPGIDGMTIEEALPYLKEHQQEITDRIYRGKYTPSPVRRVEIPKPDGGVRKLGKVCKFTAYRFHVYFVPKGGFYIEMNDNKNTVENYDSYSRRPDCRCTCRQ